MLNLVQRRYKDFFSIISKVESGERISAEEGLKLYKKADLGLLGILASYAKKNKSEDFVYFNKNVHLEPTNVCVFNCKFCSYRRKKGEEGSWEYSMEEMLSILNKYKETPITEVHIVGGAHPDYSIQFLGELLQNVKELLPKVHIKAFTAVELDYLCKKASMNMDEGVRYLKSCGLNSIPGGGAEIFDHSIRQAICNDKSTAEEWLEVHRKVHKAGLKSNATILYGHIESYEHRIDHFCRLRELQDETHGFNAFIPLKYRMRNNEISYAGEVSIYEDLKNYAVSRLMLDNFDHVKAYWPMIGVETARLSLSFGVDDLDGTIDDSTKIYSLAGVEQNGTMATEQLIEIIRSVGMIPVERDSLYKHLKEY